MKTVVQNRLQSVNSDPHEHDSVVISQEKLIKCSTANWMGFWSQLWRFNVSNENRVLQKIRWTNECPKQCEYCHSVNFKCFSELNLIKNCCLSLSEVYLMRLKVNHYQNNIYWNNSKYLSITGLQKNLTLSKNIYN